MLKNNYFFLLFNSSIYIGNYGDKKNIPGKFYQTFKCRECTLMGLAMGKILINGKIDGKFFLFFFAL